MEELISKAPYFGEEANERYQEMVDKYQAKHSSYAPDMKEAVKEGYDPMFRERNESMLEAENAMFNRSDYAPKLSYSQEDIDFMINNMRNSDLSKKFNLYLLDYSDIPYSGRASFLPKAAIQNMTPIEFKGGNIVATGKTTIPKQKIDGGLIPSSIFINPSKKEAYAILLSKTPKTRSSTLFNINYQDAINLINKMKATDKTKVKYFQKLPTSVKPLTFSEKVTGKTNNYLFVNHTNKTAHVRVTDSEHNLINTVKVKYNNAIKGIAGKKPISEDDGKSLYRLRGNQNTTKTKLGNAFDKQPNVLHYGKERATYYDKPKQVITKKPSLWDRIKPTMPLLGTVGLGGYLGYKSSDSDSKKK